MSDGGTDDYLWRVVDKLDDLARGHMRWMQEATAQRILDAAGRSDAEQSAVGDPSYMIRSLPANALDANFCLRLGHAAVHAGMAGKTDVVIGSWRRRLTHAPIPLAGSSKKEGRYRWLPVADGAVTDRPGQRSQIRG